MLTTEEGSQSIETSNLLTVMPLKIKEPKNQQNNSPSGPPNFQKAGLRNRIISDMSSGSITPINTSTVQPSGGQINNQIAAANLSAQSTLNKLDSAFSKPPLPFTVNQIKIVEYNSHSSGNSGNKSGGGAIQGSNTVPKLYPGDPSSASQSIEPSPSVSKSNSERMLISENLDTQRNDEPENAIMHHFDEERITDSRPITPFEERNNRNNIKIDQLNQQLGERITINIDKGIIGSQSKEQSSRELETPKKTLYINKNFMLLTKDELINYGIDGFRLKLAAILRTKAFDIFSITLIALYSVLIFVYLVFEDDMNGKNFQTAFYIVELGMLFYFILDVSLHLISFGRLYTSDKWNVFDIIVIVLCLIFVFLDIFIKSDSLQNILKVRAIFRLLRIFLLLRKLNTLRVIRDLEGQRERRKGFGQSGFDVRSPLEKVIEILTQLREQLDQSERLILNDLNYCIRVISSNQLYEAELVVQNSQSNEDIQQKRIDNKIGALDPQDLVKQEKNKRHDDILKLMTNYSKAPIEVVQIGSSAKLKQQDTNQSREGTPMHFKRKFSIFGQRQLTRKKILSTSQLQNAFNYQKPQTSLFAPSSPSPQVNSPPKLTNIDEQYLEKYLKLTQGAKAEIDKVCQSDFDIFNLQTQTNNNELVVLISYILAKEDLFNEIPVPFDNFYRFITKISQGYKHVPYHNKTHGADVSQTLYYYGTSCGMYEKCAMDDLDILSTIVAGACHDFEHPGFNNQYLIETRDSLALKYNDVSVLENHHIAQSFIVMVSQDQQGQAYNWKQKPGSSDIFEKLTKEDYRRARQQMISCVLATDMSKHFSELGKLKARSAANDFDPKEKDKDLVVAMMFHLADISNGTKPWNTCRKWTELLFVEFFNQGDQERKNGQQISYLMDRATVNIAKSQIGFLDVIIQPAFAAAGQLFNLQININNIENNRTNWQLCFDEFEERMLKEQQNLQDVSFNT